MESTTEKDDAVVQQKTQTRGKGGLKTMPFILGTDSSDKLASLGLSSNIVYLTTKFNMKNVEASNVINIWSGTLGLVPLIGAFISDAFIGRYWAIVTASFASLLGMVVLWLTAELPQLRPPACSPSQIIVHGSCATASKGQFGILLFGFALLAVGAAGTKPCSMTFGADQFDSSSSKGRKFIQSFFNWYYLCTSFIKKRQEEKENIECFTTIGNVL